MKMSLDDIFVSRSQSRARGQSALGPGALAAVTKRATRLWGGDGRGHWRGKDLDWPIDSFSILNMKSI